MFFTCKSAHTTSHLKKSESKTNDHATSITLKAKCMHIYLPTHIIRQIQLLLRSQQQLNVVSTCCCVYTGPWKASLYKKYWKNTCTVHFSSCKLTRVWPFAVCAMVPARLGLAGLPLVLAVASSCFLGSCVGTSSSRPCMCIRVFFLAPFRYLTPSYIVQTENTWTRLRAGLPT